MIAVPVVMLLGLASRQPGLPVPPFMAAYAGDTLWALLVFLLVGVLWPQGSLAHRAGAAGLFAAATEISQLYHAAWIDALRATTLGGLVLGYTFVGTDLVCYGVGIALGVTAEAVVRALRPAPAAAP